MDKKKLFIAIAVIVLVIIAMITAVAFLNTKNTAKVSVKEVGVSGGEIVLGTSSALSGHAGQLGTDYLHGAMSYINAVNEDGGVNGRKIKVVSYDDKYDPATCVANTQKLVSEDKVFALFNYVGTPTALKVMPIVEEEKIPLVGLFTGAHDLREPVKRYIFNIRPSYYQETGRGVFHYVEELGIKKIAVFYQNDEYGLDGLVGTEIALKGYGLTPVAKASYARGTLDVEGAVETISNSGAEAVILVGTYAPSAKFVKLCKEKGFKPIFQAVSFVGADEFAKEMGSYAEGVIVSQVVPPPSGLDVLGGTVKYRELLKKSYPNDRPNFVGLEGFVNAKVIVEGLKRAGQEITREKFVDALESMKDFSLGVGYPVNFSKESHQGLEYIYFTIIEKGEFKFFTDWKKELSGQLKGRQ